MYICLLYSESLANMVENSKTKLNNFNLIVEFYPSANNFTLALLLMLVTNITSATTRS